MAKGKIHVVPYGGSWAIRREGSDRVSKITETKNEAIGEAKRMAGGYIDDVIIHKRDGRFTKGTSYRNEPSGDGCFLTTACMKYYNLPDDCYQLSTLRHFRDTYLQHSSDGEKLIKQYYAIAPQLVMLLNQHPDNNTLYANIFHEINIACILIEKHKFSAAKKHYIKIVSHFVNYFQLA